MMTGSREIWHHSYVKREKSKHFVARPKKIFMEENITVCGACQYLRLTKFWQGMKRFVEALTAGQREQKCQKKVVLWIKCNVLKKK